ncbi:MAG: pentapeptide repeat-containing protein, partial [Clostridiales bacterium]|nr:pentapeptide repeat-containing protein [Clostridiales bacterium]
MGELVRQKRFASTGSTSREKEDFTYTLFENIDFMQDDSPVSFFRSDFRGAKFVNVIFYRNNFDRADFISSV